MTRHLYGQRLLLALPSIHLCVPVSLFHGLNLYSSLEQYFGLHPYVFKNTVTKAAQYADMAKTIGTGLFGSFAAFGASKAASTPSKPRPKAALTDGTQSPKPSWGKWVPAAYAVSGALLAGAAAGGAYYKREDLGLGYAWATDHMKYVGNLWNEAALEQRVNGLLEAEAKEGTTFRT